MSVLHVTHGTRAARRTTAVKTSSVPTRMYMEALQVTPAMAAQWLEGNVDNRRIRQHKVRQWSIVIRQGRWKLTHQGIALDENGHLLDGQHRLTAIVETGIAVPMMVAFNAPRETFADIDIQEPRSVGDVSGVHNRAVSITNIILRVALNGSVPDRASTLKAVKVIADEAEALIAFCPTTKRSISCSAVRAAAVVQAYALGDETFPFIGYRNLVLENYPELTPPQGSLLRALNGGLERIDAFARALIAFDPSRSNISKIQIKTYGNAYEAARKYCVAHGLSPELNG
jgi:hypothetical protein